MRKISDETRRKLREAGRKGGQASSGNFKHDPGRASEMGRRGAAKSAGKFSGGARAAECGRLGGVAKHKKKSAQ